jgi:hypothetical protein
VQRYRHSTHQEAHSDEHHRERPKDKNAEDRFIKVYEEGKKRILAARSRQ